MGIVEIKKAEERRQLLHLLSKKKLIILDIDDTLIKSCPAIIQHHIDTAKKIGIRVPTKREILNLISNPWTKILVKVWPEMKDKKKIAEFKKVYRSFPKWLPITVIPGAINTLKKLKKNYLLTIITGRDEYSLKKLLPELGIDLSQFTVICHGDDKITKPDPKVFEFALKRINYKLRINQDNNTNNKLRNIKKLTKKNVVYIGDTLLDANCAKKANVDFIAVLTGHFKRRDFRRYNCAVVDSVKELI